MPLMYLTNALYYSSLSLLCERSQCRLQGSLHPSTQEVEAGESEVQGHAWVQSQFKASLGCRRLTSKNHKMLSSVSSFSELCPTPNIEVDTWSSFFSLDYLSPALQDTWEFVPQVPQVPQVWLLSRAQCCTLSYQQWSSEGFQYVLESYLFILGQKVVSDCMSFIAFSDYNLNAF